MRNNTFWLGVLSLEFCVVTFFGCTTAPTVNPIAHPGMPGVYHRVESGQTLWAISKLYSVDLSQITEINHIADNTNIEPGQLIFIPNRMKTQTPLSQYSSDDFIWPVKGRVIATFGATYNNMRNEGLNITADNQSDVMASRAGKIIFYTENFGRFGKTLIIDHGDGFSTVYARVSQVYAKLGDYVARGSLIAKAGNARPYGDYLHFEIRKGHIPQNPYYYLP